MASSPTAEPAPDGEPDAAERPRALVTLLGGEQLAVPAAQVAAVVRPAAVTPVAGTAPWLAGVGAVRGRVLPVADLRRLVGLSPADTPSDGAVGDDAWWVVLDDGRRAAACAGLRVRRVAAYAPDGGPDLGPAAAAALAGLPTRGVVRLDGDTTATGADALAPAAALLDVAGLLDLVLDPPTDGG